MDFRFDGIDTYARSIAFLTVAGLLLFGFLFVLILDPRLVWRRFAGAWPVRLVLRGFRRLRLAARGEKPKASP